MSSASHILLALLTLVLAAPAASAGAGETPARSVSVTGQGEASGRPDLAEINAGVQTFADTVVEASRENQAVVDRIFAALEQQGIEQDDIQTANYSIWAEQDYPRGGEGRKPRITGYRVSNIVHVKVRDIDRIGQVLAAVTDAGANSINGIQFSVEDTDALEARARRLAMADARARAESLASLAGVELGEVLSISLSATPGFPRPLAAARAMEMDAAAPAPGIVPGQQSVSVSVHVTYAIR
ncbi:MAG TPA: SIMPL domain-containing protein [Woeseiaceae bacterium]|nr:SIMPL domain-containing protein [Woeseiaceae bacterium]